MTPSQPLQQSPGFARALSAFGTTVLSDTPVILHRQFGPFAAVCFSSRARAQDVGDSCVQVVNGEDDTPHVYRAAGFRQIVTPAHVAEWDLTHDLPGQMSPKWRNQWRKAARAGLRMREHIWDGDDHWLFAQADTMARKRRYRALPTPLLATFAQLNRGDAVLFEAYDRGTPVAACLILRHGATATYQTAWSSGTGHALGAPRVLLTHAAQRMAALGHQTLDLGLVETDLSPGLARFKLGTGARARKLGGTWARWRGRG